MWLLPWRQLGGTGVREALGLHTWPPVGVGSYGVGLAPLPGPGQPGFWQGRGERHHVLNASHRGPARRLAWGLGRGWNWFTVLWNRLNSAQFGGCSRSFCGTAVLDRGTCAVQ